MIKLTADSCCVNHIVLFIIGARRFVDACAGRMAIVGRHACVKVVVLDRIDEQADDGALGFVPSARQRAARSVAMTAAAEQLSDARHIDQSSDPGRI